MRSPGSGFVNKLFVAIVTRQKQAGIPQPCGSKLNRQYSGRPIYRRRHGPGRKSGPRRVTIRRTTPVMSLSQTRHKRAPMSSRCHRNRAESRKEHDRRKGKAIELTLRLPRCPALRSFCSLYLYLTWLLASRSLPAPGRSLESRVVLRLLDFVPLKYDLVTLIHVSCPRCWIIPPRGTRLRCSNTLNSYWFRILFGLLPNVYPWAEVSGQHSSHGAHCSLISLQFELEASHASRHWNCVGNYRFRFCRRAFKGAEQIRIARAGTLDASTRTQSSAVYIITKSEFEFDNDS